MFLVGKQQLLDVLHSDRIEGWHDDFVILYSITDNNWVSSLSPNNPLFLVLDIKIVKAQTFLGESVLVVFSHNFLDLLVKLLSSWEGSSASNRPNHCENDKWLNNLFELLNFFSGDFLQLSVIVWSEVAVHDSKHTVDQVVVDSHDWLWAVLSHELKQWFHVLLEVVQYGWSQVLS